MDVHARWTEVVQRPEADVPLDEAALLISASANPRLDVSSQLSRLDEIAARVEQRETNSVCRLLFDDLGLRGDEERYDDPENSYLDRVLDRGRGIPITLSVLLIEIARRCDVRLEAVGMPGHFLVRDPAAPDELINAFDQGRRLGQDACERLMRLTTGSTDRLTPDMLVAAGSHAVLIRMLANLDRSFDGRQDRRSLRWVSELRMSLPSRSAPERLQLAGRLSALGRFDAAATVLEATATTTNSKAAAERMRREAMVLRSRLN